LWPKSPELWFKSPEVARADRRVHGARLEHLRRVVVCRRDPLAEIVLRRIHVVTVPDEPALR